MDFKLGAFLLVSAHIICTTLALSPCMCARIFLPVCGSDGITYSNKCRLDCAVYESGTEITVTKDGPCQTPPPEEQTCICTDEYKPICGSDGQTYPNKCSMECQQRKYNPSLTEKHAGACTIPQQPECACPFLYSPVCGSDGKTYDNDCALNCATAQNSNLSIASKGICADAVKVVDN